MRISLHPWLTNSVPLGLNPQSSLSCVDTNRFPTAPRLRPQVSIEIRLELYGHSMGKHGGLVGRPAHNSYEDRRAVGVSPLFLQCQYQETED